MTTTGNFMFAWAGLCAFLQVSHNADIEATEEIKDAKNIVSTNSAPSSSPPNLPCFMDDVLATLRESLEEDGHVRNDSMAQFSVCTENSPMFLQLAQDAGSEILDVMIPTQVVLRKETNKRVLVLTFGPTNPPQTMLSPAVLLFPSESIFKMSGIRFTSQLLNPSTQTPCTSEDSRYILLTGNNQSFPPTWDIVMQTSSDTNVVDHEDSSSTISIFALLLFSSRGTDPRPPNNNDFSHNSFLCELRHFLVQSTPQDHHAPLLNLGLLRSLPSQPIGLASSESLLADLINSSAPTILSFTQGSLLHAHHEELALSPILLQELGQRLGQVLEEVSQVMEAVEDGRVRGRLERLKRLSGFPFADRVGGKLQYRAFLLFKALQMARRAFNPPRAQRSTRANPNAPSICGLKTLTVSLERYLISPNTADIKNCRGVCAFPMGLTRNHAVLLNSHIERGHSSERAPCCVPVAYDKMEVVDLGELGTTLKTEPDMVATACECR